MNEMNNKYEKRKNNGQNRKKRGKLNKDEK